MGFVVEGVECPTTQRSLSLLSSGIYEHKRSDPHFSGLFKWHLIEEIEHRNVTYNIYQHLYGDHMARAGMCWLAQHHLFSFYADCLRIMYAAEGERGGESFQTVFKHRLLFTRIDSFGKRLRSRLPGYSPRGCQLPADFASLTDPLSAQATSVQ